MKSTSLRRGEEWPGPRWAGHCSVRNPVFSILRDVLGPRIPVAFDVKILSFKSFLVCEDLPRWSASPVHAKKSHFH